MQHLAKRLADTAFWNGGDLGALLLHALRPEPPSSSEHSVGLPSWMLGNSTMSLIPRSRSTRA